MTRDKCSLSCCGYLVSVIDCWDSFLNKSMLMTGVGRCVASSYCRGSHARQVDDYTIVLLSFRMSFTPSTLSINRAP